MNLLWGQFPVSVLQISGDRALVSFRHPSETELVRMWVRAEEAGIETNEGVKRPAVVRFTGGGVQGACHPCGNAFEECECG